MQAPEFSEFPKISRLFRQSIITEKIDGTNASILISDTLEPFEFQSGRVVPFMVGSRTRWIYPENDNYGFAKWAYENAEELLKLGPGQHFGEWWGQGIQRKYGLNEKRFSLFNVGRWKDQHGTRNLADVIANAKPLVEAPKCCYIVPVLQVCTMQTDIVDAWINKLQTEGSYAAPGFMKPEGVVVYHEPSRNLYKVTCEKDEQPKGIAGA